MLSAVPDNPGQPSDDASPAAGSSDAAGCGSVGSVGSAELASSAASADSAVHGSPPVAAPADAHDVDDQSQLPIREASDAELMRRHVAGHPDAFGELFRRHRDRMWAVALRTTANRELAADCVQDAFISAYRRAASFRGDAAFTTWMHRITVNACLDRLRRERSTSPLPETDIADPHDAHDTAAIVQDVRAALAKLPEQQRLALVLVDMQGLSVAEAAAILDIAEGTVKSRCFRGRAALAELLRPRVEVPGGLDADRPVADGPVGDGPGAGPGAGSPGRSGVGSTGRSRGGSGRAGNPADADGTSSPGNASYPTERSRAAERGATERPQP